MECKYPDCAGGQWGTVCHQECRLPRRRLTDSEIGELWFSCKLPEVPESAARILIRAAEKELARMWNVAL